ncbi:Ferrichrome-iron receptor [Serratia rubidaea]|uniref:TonB-dependent siderophore receptor n=1 Tax=Serratia rubidaea TaxID=61652 RepID=UPI0007734AA9|nr:TonB-dependent siderophore receptor [Serratia rubidaea]AML58344.1 Ferrichrome-iron receptor [Serratia rubidaea]
MSGIFPVKRSRLFCAIALFLPLSSWAEDTLLVTAGPADTADSATHGYTAGTSQGATKTDRPLILTGQTVSVVTRQQMTDQNALTVNDALKYTPGVFTNFSGGATRYDTIALRGFHGGDVNNTFLDGLRLLSDSGSYNALQVDPWFLERVDVIKGPSSVMYGQSIPGGLVALTSKRPQFATEGHLNLTGGNHHTQGGAFDVTGALSDQWAYRLTGMTRSSDTMYDHQREERYAIAPSLLWQPSEDTSLLLKAYLQKDPSGGYHSAVPADGSLYASQGDKLGRGFFDGDSRHNVFKRWEQIYSYAFSHRFNDIWTFRQNASYTHSNVELEQVYQAGWNDDHTLLNRYYSGSNTSLDAYAVDNQLEAEFATGLLDHKVLLGLDYQRFRNNLWDEAGGASPLNPYTGEASEPLLTGVTRTDSRRRYQQTGVYLQDEIALNNWYLNLAGRYDRLESKNTNLTADSSDSRNDHHFSGRASLLYHFDNGFSPYASYSTAITPEALADKDGHMLKPSTSKQYEVGLKYQPPGSTSLYSVSLYDLTQKDVANRVVQQSYYDPAGKVHSQGIELEARSQVTDRLNVIAGYTYNKVKFKDAIDGNNGNTPYLAPDQMATLWGQYDAGYGLNVGAGVRYIGKQWADNENTRRIPSVTLLDASVRMNLAQVAPTLKGAYVQLNVNNLADRKYVAACYGTSYCYWGQERSVVATVGYDF